MAQRQPGFEDIDPTKLGFGSLGGEGVEDHYDADVHQDKQGQGMHINVHCQQCGQKTRVDFTWDELIIASMKMVPVQYGWMYMEKYGRLTPNVGCANCKEWLPVLLTPDECEKYVRSGIAAQKIDPARIQQIAQSAAPQQQQFQGMQRR